MNAVNSIANAKTNKQTTTIIIIIINVIPKNASLHFYIFNLSNFARFATYMSYS